MLVLFPGTGSEVVELTLAALVTAPVAVGATLATRLKVALSPFVSVAMVQVIAPLAPGDGVVQANAGPVVW
jgi:hypothetical protein